MITPALVERDHVNRKPHPARVDAAARHDPEPFARLETIARQQPDRPRGTGIRHADAIGHHGTRIDIPCHQRHAVPLSPMPNYFFMLSIIGNSTVMNLMAAGPIVTTQIAGKMQKTSGNTIFTPVFAAASSAR